MTSAHSSNGSLSALPAGSIILAMLALGVSLTTVVISIADRVLLREWPSADPTRVTAISAVHSSSSPAGSIRTPPF